MKKLYFAHPINTYDTPLERTLLAVIAAKFPHHEIVNPSDQIHKDMVARLRAQDPTVNVMPYFEELTASCDVLIALPFGDGKWGAGVWTEAQKMLGKHGCVWSIYPDDGHVFFVSHLSEALRLTVDETRNRIRNPDGSPKSYA